MKMFTLRQARIALSILTLAATASAYGDFLYVAAPPVIEIFDVGPDGKQMVRKSAVTVPATLGATSAMTVVGNSLYVSSSASVVAQFTIDQETGQLTHQGDVATGPPPHYVAARPGTDRRPGTLYVGSFGSNDIRVYSINSRGGSLTQLPGTSGTVSVPGINALLVDPTRRFLFTGNRAASRLCTFRINQRDGSLDTTPNCACTPGPPASLQSAGGVLFARFSTGNSNFMSAWTIDGTTGGLTPRGADLDIGGTSAYAMGISADGATLFVPRQGNFTLVSTGNPMTMSPAAFSTTPSPNCQLPPAIPGAVLVHPNGKALYFTSVRSITGIDLTTGGVLTPTACNSMRTTIPAMALLSR